LITREKQIRRRTKTVKRNNVRYEMEDSHRKNNERNKSAKGNFIHTKVKG
jgi:hypothetical protein